MTETIEEAGALVKSIRTAVDQLEDAAKRFGAERGVQSICITFGDGAAPYAKRIEAARKAIDDGLVFLLARIVEEQDADRAERDSLRDRLLVVQKERDDALARVKELEAAECWRCGATGAATGPA